MKASNLALCAIFILFLLSDIFMYKKQNIIYNILLPYFIVACDLLQASLKLEQKEVSILLIGKKLSIYDLLDAA